MVTGSKSSMYVAIDSRLLGITMTIFILLLTVKSELLNNKLITMQLVLVIPFLFGSIFTSAKIVNKNSLSRYYAMNRFCSSVAHALIFNTVGLLVATYVSFWIGVLYFIVLLFNLIWLTMLKTPTPEHGFKNYIKAIIMIPIILLLGLLPTIL